MKRSIIVPFLLVAAVAFAVYATTLGHGFVWDDTTLVPIIEKRFQRDGLTGVLANPFTLKEGQRLGYYRPVVQASLWLDGRIGGGHPAVYHATNVALHAACSGILLLLLLSWSARPVPAVAGALLFAVHPVHVESVAFISGRTDLWAALFALASALAWVRVRRGLGKRPRLETVAGGAAFTLALLSKESAAVLPAILLAWDLLDPTRRERPGISWFRRNGPWLAVWLPAVLVVVAIRWAVAGVGFGGWGESLSGFDLSAVSIDRSLIPAVVAKYARLLVVPWPLSGFYTRTDVSPAGAIDVAAAIVLLVPVAVFGRKAAGRSGLLAAVWLGGFLLPVLGIVPIAGASVAERFLYLPSVGLAALVAWAPWPSVAREPLRRIALATGIALGVVLAALATARATVWRDEITLFSNIVSTSPFYPEGWNNLGAALLAAGREGEALESFRRAVDLRPDYADPLTNLGLGYLSRGRVAASIELLERAASADPSSTETHNDLGIAYQHAGRYADAVRAHREAVRLSPDNVKALNNLGNALLGAGRHEEAVRAYGRALELDPDLAPAHHNLGLAWLALGRSDLASHERDALVGLDPRLAESLAVEIARRQGRVED